MKKYIKILTTLSLGVFITACGTTTVGGGGETSLSVQTKQVSLSQDARSLDVDLFIENNYKKDIGVTLKDLVIDDVRGCIVESSNFSQNPVVFENNTGKVVHTKVNFAEVCNPSGFYLKGNILLALPDSTNEIFFRSNEQELNVTYDSNSTVVNGASTTLLPTYKFFNTPKDIIINKANKSYPFKIQLLDTNHKVVEGKSVNIIANYNIEYGELSSYSETTDKNGFANFSFQSPDSIEDLIGKSFSLIVYNEDGQSKIEKNIQFKFSKSATPTEPSETNGTTDTINYGIKFSLEDEGSMKFNLEEKKSFTIELIDKDSGKAIDDSKIDKITITSKQAKLLKLFDANEHTTASEKLVYTNKNSSVVYVQTYTNSGLADIDVLIEYRNDKGTAKIIKKTYSTMVLSGPPTAFSINSAGISYNPETKWFENKFLISAVDRYNNIVNISPTIYVSAMTGFTRDSSGKEVLYGNFGNVEGKLNVDKDSKTATFEANSTVFDNIDVNRDYLYVFGQIDDYEALGKWDIDSFEDSHTATTLALSEAFNGENHSNLGFALGHNYLVDPGSSESGEWQVKIDSTDGKYKLDKEGKAFVTLKFPTYLIGKRIAFAVNFLGKTPETGKILRSGEVKFKTLHSFEGVLPPDAINVEKGTVGSVTRSRAFYINTGTSDMWRVLNSHVNCKTKSSNLRVVGFRENKLVKTVEEFKENGNSYGAYWSLDLELIDSNTSGTYTFDECQVANLPLF